MKERMNKIASELPQKRIYCVIAGILHSLYDPNFMSHRILFPCNKE